MPMRAPASRRDWTQGYASNVGVGAGFGVEAVRLPDTKLRVEVGPGYRIEPLADYGTATSGPVARGRIDLPRFYARRARRLLPAALTALLGTAVLTLATMPPTRWAAIGADIAAAAGYLVNWRMADASVDYLDLSRAPSPVRSRRGGRRPGRRR